MVFTGLIDAGRFWDNTRALAVATNFANWTDTHEEPEAAQWQCQGTPGKALTNYCCRGASKTGQVA